MQLFIQHTLAQLYKIFVEEYSLQRVEKIKQTKKNRKNSVC